MPKMFERVLNAPLPAGIYLLKVNNRNTTTRREICSKLIGWLVFHLQEIDAKHKVKTTGTTQYKKIASLILTVLYTTK